MVCLDTLTIWYYGGSGYYETTIQTPPCTSTTVREILNQTTLSLDNCYSTTKNGSPIDLDGNRFDIFGYDNQVYLYKISCPVPLYSHGHIDTLHMRHVAGGDDYSAMQGPAPEGFHVPLVTEWEGVRTIMSGLRSTSGSSWRSKLHIPYAGYRSDRNAGVREKDSTINLWSSSVYPSDNNYAYYLYAGASSSASTQHVYGHSKGLPIRCFKDSFETPTSSWTVIQGTLGSAGIFWDQTKGLISITSDGTTGYTIQDKNLGATTVYNDGDTLTSANCGYYYQWGNNYGFPGLDTSASEITTSTTRVDASGYGPGNYYSSSTFIITNDSPFSWVSVQNNNLRGGVTGIIPGGEDHREPVYYGPQITLLSYEEILAMAGTDKADDIVAILNEHPEEYYNKLSSEGHMELDSYHTGVKNGYVILDTDNYIKYFGSMTDPKKGSGAGVTGRCIDTHIGYIPSTGLRDYFCDNEPI